MRTIIGRIIFIFCVWFVGYAVGKFTIYDTIEDYKRQLAIKDMQYKTLSDFCEVLKKDNREYIKYVPRTELKKDIILMLHKRGLTGKEIGEKLGFKKSTINVALRRWGIKQK